MNRAALAAPIAVLAVLVPCAAMAEEQSFDCVAEPAQRVQIGSAVTGLLAEVRVGRGDQVAKGEVVARLDGKVEEANVALARSQAGAREAFEAQRTRLNLAQAALDRARQLVSSGSVTRSRVEELEAAVQIAERDLETENHRVRLAAIELERQEALLSRQSMVSPVDGFVVAQALSAGEFVRQDSPVMTIVQADPLHVEAYMPVSLWGRVQVGSGGRVVLDHPEGTTRDAEVTVVDRVFDAASGTFGIRLELPNPGGAIPAGQRCRVAFDLPDLVADTPLPEQSSPLPR